MKQALKQFTAWAINLQNNVFKKARVRLTFYYTLVVVVIIGLFSVALYFTLIQNIKGHVLESVVDEDAQTEVINDTANDLQMIIIIIDGLVLVLIGYLSYMLSGKTLKPIAKAMEAQKRFSAEASHDLRTPLAIMQTDIEVTLNNKNENIKQYRKTLESNLEEVKKMSTLASNLLLMARTEEGLLKTDMVSIEVASFVEKIILKFKKQAEAKNIKLSFMSEKINPIKISPNYFERAIQNIIQNAINYTVNGGSINVIAKQENQHILIRIDDTGVGIKESDLPHVFNRFYKASHSRNDTSSSGLGLPIARQIIEQHGGTITIKSKEGVGTSVFISIPRA